MTNILPASDARDRRLLRYFGTNLFAVGPAARNWPGFTYSDDQWQRFQVHADTVSGLSAAVALSATVAIFLVLAALAMGLFFVPAMTWLYPDPDKMPAVVFLALLFGVVLITIGVGLPLSLDLGGRLADGLINDTSAPLIEADRALAARIRRQIWRMIAILCGIGLPVALILVIYNIDLEPEIRWLKIVAYLGIGISIALGAWRARKPAN